MPRNVRKDNLAEMSSLCDLISQSFPKEIAKYPKHTIAYATGDAHSVQNIVEILDWRSWTDIDFDDLQNCGASELASYLQKEAFAYYLPSLLTNTLNPKNEYSRLHEIVPVLLLPANDSYRDVWILYSDGQLDDFIPGDPNFVFPQRVYDRVAYAKHVFTLEQKVCVAKYLRIALQSETLQEDVPILGRFIQYWNS